MAFVVLLGWHRAQPEPALRQTETLGISEDLFQLPQSAEEELFHRAGTAVHALGDLPDRQSLDAREKNDFPVVAAQVADGLLQPPKALLAGL